MVLEIKKLPVRQLPASNLVFILFWRLQFQCLDSKLREDVHNDTRKILKTIGISANETSSSTAVMKPSKKK